MHHVVLERWSRGNSVIHRRDPRAKMGALAAFLLVVATAQHGIGNLAAMLFVMLLLALAMARIPLIKALLRAGIVLALTWLLAVSAWISGDPARALALLLKSYLSALAVLAVVATTPLPVLLRGLEVSGAPRFFLMVIQFLYRYLFVIVEEAQFMTRAAQSRGASIGRLGPGEAAGALAALFARAYGRAGEIHRAMLARGFTGRFPSAGTLCFRAADAVFLGAGVLLPVILRTVAERLA